MLMAPLSPLIVAVAQPPCSGYDVAANALAHARAVRAAEARVVVFPEMSLTGYELDAAVVAREDRRLAPLIEACDEAGSIALVGAPVGGDHEADSQRYNGLLAIDGAGATVAYRKLYLSGDEATWFSQGPAPAVIDVGGWRLGLAICKDTGVPEHAARTCALAVDAYVAGVLEVPADAAVPEQRARRITAEQGVWVAIASFAGDAGWGYCDAPGGSGIWRPDGERVADAGPAIGALASAVLEPG
jgi:predicted amidohydrolase